MPKLTPLNFCTASQLADRGLCRVNLFMESELAIRALEHALDQGMSRSQLIINLIKNELGVSK